MTQHVYGSGPCTTMLGFDTVEALAQPASLVGRGWLRHFLQVGPHLAASHQPIWEQLVGIGGASLNIFGAEHLLFGDVLLVANLVDCSRIWHFEDR